METAITNFTFFRQKPTLKKLGILSVLLFCSLATFSQVIIGNSYYTVPAVITVYGLNREGNLDSTLDYKLRAQTKFTVNGFDKKNNLKISCWKYEPNARLDSSYNYEHPIPAYRLTKENLRKQYIDLAFVSEWANSVEFAITPDDFNASCKPYFGKKTTFTWGFMTLPLKARLGNHKEKYFELDQGLNLGFTFGARKQIQSKKELAVNYLLGISVTNVKTDTLSWHTKSNYNNTNSAALSLSTGLLFQYEKFQIGSFLGFDYIPGQLGRDWRNQGKPWIGIAIGVSLFSENSTQGAKPGTNKSSEN
ncbi:MAG: hypothetical protein WKF97_04755 [Chitinophagaceae bacterium]